MSILILILGGGVGSYIAIHQKMRLPEHPTELVIEHGSNIKTIASQLAERKMIPHEKLFEIVIRIQGKSNQIKSGYYLFNKDLNILEIIDKLTQGESKQFVFKFVEGTNSRQLLNYIQNHQHLKKEVAQMSERQILRQLDIPSDLINDQNKIEGLFMPNTYYFSAGMSDLSLLKQSHKALVKHLMIEWDKRDQSVPYKNPYEALIMASIIEKETSEAEERPLVASVFVNRLKQNMRLQTDPTVIYGMGKRYIGTIHKKDLQTDTPYNTYTRFGLPPTPISMVSLEALRASLNPAKSGYLYFVAKGKNAKGHNFSTTYEEHQKYVQEYLKTL